MTKKLVTLMILSLFIGGCVNLDIKPENYTTREDYWKTESDVTNALFRCYTQGGEGILMDATSQMIREGLADNYVAHHAGEGILPFGNGTANNQDWYVSEIWQYIYKRLKILKDADVHMKGITFQNNIRKERFRHEFKALTGIAYIRLLNDFGGVPYQSLDQLNPSRRMTVEQTIDTIRVNLDYAAKGLPTEYKSDADVYRITKGGTYAYMARVLLQQAYNYDSSKGEVGKLVRPEYLKEALKYVKKVKDLGVYSLYSNYKGLFSTDGDNINNKERIVFFQNWNNTPLYHGPPTVGAYGSLDPTKKLVDTYLLKDGRSLDDLKNGSATDQALRDELLASPSTEANLDKRDPRMRETIMGDGTAYPEGEHMDTYTTINKPGAVDNSSITGYYAYKTYNDQNRAGSNNIDFIHLRYAEVLCIEAECHLALNDGNSQVVIDCINALRKRAGLDMQTATVKYDGNWTHLRDLFRLERNVEFAGEGLRVLDIRRWCIADKVMNATVYGQATKKGDPSSFVVAEKRTFKKDAMYLWPIPYDEIKNHKDIGLNPGW